MQNVIKSANRKKQLNINQGTILFDNAVSNIS